MRKRPLDLDLILGEVERVTSLEKGRVTEVMERVEQLLHDSLPSSPISSPRSNFEDEIQKVPEVRRRSSTSSGEDDLTHATPTKVLDVARDH